MNNQVIYASGNPPMQRTVFTLDVATEAYFSCSVVFNGETLILGGKKEPNQVSSCFHRSKINFRFNSSAKLNPVDLNDMVIYHSLKICMHKFIAAFINSKTRVKQH